MSGILKGKWHTTTAGRVGIVLGVAALALGTYLGIKHFRKPKINLDTTPDNSQKTITNTPAAAPAKPQSASKTYTADQLPNGGNGCADVKTTFDKVYDYVKCNGDWWTISKDAANGKIKTWTSLANNKTATDLLNNRYS